MTDVKGLTKIGVHHKLFPQGDTVAYVNEYGMLINVVETPCGFDAYMDIENKYDKRFGAFDVAKCECSFVHFATLDEVSEYANTLIYKYRAYHLSSYDNTDVGSALDLCNRSLNGIRPYKTEFTTESGICTHGLPFSANCRSFEELFAYDGVKTHPEITSDNYAFFIGRNEQLFKVYETDNFVHVITTLSKVECNLYSQELDFIEDGIALSDVGGDPSFELISENYYHAFCEFNFQGNAYEYEQYLDHTGQRIIRCLDTKKESFIFTDDEAEDFADSKGYDIYGYGDNVPDDETWARESGEYIKGKIIGELKSIANPLAYFTRIGVYNAGHIDSRLLFNNNTNFIDNLLNIVSGAKFVDGCATYTFAGKDENGAYVYDVLESYPRDDYSRKYQVKLQLIQK